LAKTDSAGYLEWYQAIGGPAGDYAWAAIITQDGGYALAGQTSSYGTGTIDFYLVKTDARGNLQWQRTFGGGGGDICQSLQQTSDGGYILGGYSSSFGGYDDMYVVKTDSQGNLQWQRNYGGNGIDDCYSLRQTTNGGYVLAGGYQDPILGERMWLVKIDSVGNMQWDQTFGYAGSARAHAVIQTSDGGYALAGRECLNGPNLEHVYMAKTDSLGRPEWEFYTIADDPSRCYSILETPDKGFLLAGGNAAVIMLWKVSSIGVLQWIDQFTYDPIFIALSCYSMQETTDGQFILGGIRYDNPNLADLYLMRIEGLQQAGIGLTPQGVPITIPPTGGSFQFNLSITNCGTIPCRPDAWIMMQMPSGAWQGPVLGPIALTLPAGGSIERLRTQNIPGRAPAGTYVYRGYVGDYPAKWDSSSFTFVKLGAAAEGRHFVGGLGNGIEDWSNIGESLTGENSTFITHHSSFITSVSPNPLNPTTILSYELRAASFVNLKVFDTNGRFVTTLVNGWREAGTHEATFPPAGGPALPSGIYLYRIEAGQFAASGKMLLLK